MSIFRDSGMPPELSQICFFPHNPSLCMVSLDENFFLKNVWYVGCDLLNFQDFTSDRIQEYISFHSSSCKSLTFNLGLECVSLKESWNYEVDHSKDYLLLKESCLSNLFLNIQLLNLLANVIQKIFPFITLEILLSANECMNYRASQILLFSLHLDQFHVFPILAFLFTSFDDYDASMVCYQSQRNSFSHFSDEEDDSIIYSICEIVQIDLSSFITDQEYDALINPSDHYFFFDECHSFDHFPNIISNDIFFTSFGLRLSTSRYSEFFQVVEALQPSLMVMSGPHCLDMTTEYDQIYLPLQDSHHNLIPLIENSSFQKFWGYQEDYHEFCDPIVEWLEQSYLEIFIRNNKSSSSLTLAKEFGVDGDTSVRIF